MADLTGRDAGRGQLLLVTGFAIAVAIVALVLLLNTAIYTENLATRSVDTGESDALAYRDAVERSLWPAVSEVNDGDTTRTERVGNAGARVDRVAELNARRHLLEGTAATVTNRTYHNGTRLVQTNTSRTVTPTGAPTTANWTMATDADDVHAAELNVTGGLESTTDTDEAFSIAVVGDGGDEWRVYVYEDAGTGDVTLAVKNGTAPIDDGVCAGQFAGPPRLNLTAGTVNGTDCGALAFGSGISEPYDDVLIQYGNRTTAEYTLTVNTTLSPAVDPSFDDSPTTTAPYQAPVVYSLHADIVYESAELTYRARIYAGPEADG